MVNETIREIIGRLPFGDKTYINLRFLMAFGYRMNWQNPRTFNEKLQWMKIYGTGSDLSRYADKYFVREYVEQKVGCRYLIPMFGVYNSVDEIPFDQLPNEFVLKATHGSGWNFICTNKNELNIPKVKKQLNTWLKQNFYRYGRETVYKRISPRIIGEVLLNNGNPYNAIPDYKLFCFQGKAHFIQYDANRFTDHRRNFYSVDWQLLPFQLIYPPLSEVVQPPKHLEEMIDVAETLASDFPFVRIDLYEVNDQIFFGEMTFYPESGFGFFRPKEWDAILGSHISLNLLQS